MTERAFKEQLLPDERLVWLGRPGGGIIFTARDVFLVPFSLLWCGLVFHIATSALHGRPPVFPALVFALFVCFGIYIVAGRFLVDAWLRGRTRYAVTDRRVLILRPRPFGDFIAVNLDRLPEARLTEGRAGRGSIRFGQPASMWGGRTFSAWSPALDPTPQFLVIPEVRRVFDLVQRSTALPTSDPAGRHGSRALG